MLCHQVLAMIGLFAALASAAPMARQAMALSQNDISVLQLAHYLENLEFSLYSGACHNYTDADYQSAGVDATQNNVCAIASHEQIHADTLAQVLASGGVQALPPCEYSFPYTDPKSFVDVANMITSAGIGAYLGGSELLADNPTLEESSGSILTIEARHDAYLRNALGGSPFPNAFDTALTALWVFNLAQMFVVSCPQQLPGVSDLPTLNVTSPPSSPDLTPVAAGTPIAFAWDPSSFLVHVPSDAPLYIALVNQNVSAPIFQEVQTTGPSSGTVPLPEGVTGVAFAALTVFSGGLTLNDLSLFGTLAGPAEVVVS